MGCVLPGDAPDVSMLNINTMIKKILTNMYLLLSIAIFVGGYSLYRDLLIGSPHCFQRSGSIITILGAVLSARKLIIIGIKESIKGEFIISGGDAKTDFKQIEIEARKNVNSAYLGISLIVIGTLVWGYGDLVFKLF